MVRPARMSEDVVSAIVLRPGRLSWTTLQRRKNRWEASEEQSAAFEMPANGDWGAPEVAARLKAAASAVKGRCVTALVSDQVLMRVVRLPTVDVGEIRDMAALQVDKFSPFPADQMAVGQEVLEQKDGASRVLIAAAPREVVEKRGAILQAAGLFPRDMDIEVLGWWRLIQQEKQAPETGRHVAILLDDAAVELLVTENGVPAMIRALGAASLSAPVEAAAEIAEEVNYTLTALESEWGAGAPDVVRVWHRNDLPEEFLSTLRASLDVGLETRHLETLPPLSEGLARRAVERGPHLVDLAPPEWKSAIENRKLKRVLLAASSAFVAVWLLALGGVVAGVEIEKRSLAGARAALDELAGPAREVEQFRSQVESLKRYSDRSLSALECLREVSERLPPGVDLTAFRYKKYGQVSLQGEAATGAPIYDFLSAIEQSKLFVAVTPEGVTEQQRGGQMRSQFRVTLTLPPDESTNTVAGVAGGGS